MKNTFVDLNIVFAWLNKYQKQNGYMPTTREIAKQFGYRTPASAIQLLHKLEKLKAIKIQRSKLGIMKSRAIKLIK